MADQTIYVTYPNTSRAYNTECPEAHIASVVSVVYPTVNTSETTSNDGQVIRIPTQRITAVVERTQEITAVIDMEVT